MVEPMEMNLGVCSVEPSIVDSLKYGHSMLNMAKGLSIFPTIHF